jgi:hypothetical protein
MPNSLRSSMADLIGHLRVRIADPAGAGQVFTDLQLQDFLDGHQLVVRYVELMARPTIPPGGSVSQSAYKDYFSALGFWESDAVFANGAYAALTPDTKDELTGHWIFNAGQLPPVYMTGKTYDLYGAAVDALGSWAAKEKLSFSFAADGQQFQESQKVEALLKLADTYRAKVRIGAGAIVQTDYAPDGFQLMSSL